MRPAKRRTSVSDAKAPACACVVGDAQASGTNRDQLLPYVGKGKMSYAVLATELDHLRRALRTALGRTDRAELHDRLGVAIRADSVRAWLRSASGVPASTAGRLDYVTGQWLLGQRQQQGSSVTARLTRSTCTHRADRRGDCAPGAIGHESDSLVVAHHPCRARGKAAPRGEAVASVRGRPLEASVLAKWRQAGMTVAAAAAACGMGRTSFKRACRAAGVRA